MEALGLRRRFPIFWARGTTCQKSMASRYYLHGCRVALAVTLVVASLLMLNGCGPKDVRTIGSGVTPANGRISKEDLREQLDKFAEYFKATFRQMSSELNDRVPGKRTEKTTLQMRARMTQALNAMLDQDNPVVAFIETWALCVRLRMYLDEGEGADLYAEGQEIAVGAAKRLEAEIERIGIAFLKNDVFDAASKNVKEFANATPIKGTFSNVTVFATEARKGQVNPFVSVLKIPMTPFRAIEGVDRTASAIHRFTDTAERFSDIVRELPESSRWQMQLLLYDLEETDMTKAFLKALTQFSESSERLTNSVEQMPKQLGEQFEKSVEQLDARQANLQKTLDQAEKTAATVGETIKELNKTTEMLNTTAKDVTLTANAWETAAKATGEIVKEYNKIASSSSGGPSFDIKEYRSAAEQTSQAANDIKALLAAVDDFSKSRNYGAVINRVTLNAAAFVAFVFVTALLYRIVSARLARRRSPKAS